MAHHASSFLLALLETEASLEQVADFYNERLHEEGWLLQQRAEGEAQLYYLFAGEASWGSVTIRESSETLTRVTVTLQAARHGAITGESR